MLTKSNDNFRHLACNCKNLVKNDEEIAQVLGVI